MKKIIIYTDGGARGNPEQSFCQWQNSMKPSGFITSATGKLPFSRPLSHAQDLNQYYFGYEK